MAQFKVQTPMMRGGKGDKGDRIEALIDDSDKALKGLPSKLSQQPGPDPKSLKDAFLETSPAFQEMLEALEEFDKQSVGGAAPATKYDQALFAALRTMLRECLFTKNAGLKKHHIDRVYAWFQEKKHAADPGSAGATVQGTQRTALVSSMAKTLPRPQTAPERARPEHERRSRYLSKLRGEPQEEQVETMAWAADSVPPQPEGAGEGDKPDLPPERAAVPAERRIREFKMRNLRVSQMRRQGIPAEQIRAADRAAEEAKTKMKRAESAPGHRPMEKVVASDQTDRAVKELWLRKRQEEDMDRRSEMEVQEAMQWWAQNRARIEEEISRRQESIRFASQTARLHSRPASAFTTARSRPGSSRPVSALTEEDARNRAMRLVEDLQGGFTSDEEEEDGVEVIEDVMTSVPLPEKFQKVAQLRTPYDGLRPSNTGAGWAHNSASRPISARLAGKDTSATHNFGEPDGALQPYSPTKTRPQTAGARVDTQQVALQSYEQTGALVLVKHDVELHGFSSPHTSRPASSYRYSQATTARHSAVTTPTETPRKRDQSPGSSRPTSALSSRTAQLTEVDRIKRSFARSKIVCPINVIERALCVPEDRSYAKCVESLPRAGWKLLPDPIIAEAKKAKAGKKGKKGKGKKGPKDLTPDRTMDSLIKELVDKDILKLPPKVGISDFVGHYKNLDAIEQKALDPVIPEPSMAQIRQVVVEQLILPLGSLSVHQKAPYVNKALLYGPPGTGKTLLANAISRETGSNYIDLSARNLDPGGAGSGKIKYPDKKGANSAVMMLHIAFKVAKALAPSVMVLDEAHWTFLADKKKVKAQWPGEKPPSRFLKDFLKEAKFLKENDRILIVGTSNKPYLCEKGDLKKFNAFFKEFKLFLPLPDYASLQLLWRTLIARHGGAITDSFDLQTLSWICKTAGYTAGAVDQVVAKVLTQRRLQRLPVKPLSHTEFVPHLAKVDPVFKDEYDTFQAWTAKNNPQGKPEEKPKKADKAEKKGAKKKK
uniref:AAA+ ATPase domain-containing protein n=3 Tax=Hemiselmis andersenii TaxID=464988 RepID=A0A7S1E580_HEMAN|mmetsp:Transcript_35679/g.86918  ORF Transcript_35679/g.86918 Transcript_35679/m.86918 type:complete len:999 (+) Transcript_35679:117-3113(+)